MCGLNADGLLCSTSIESIESIKSIESIQPSDSIECIQSIEPIESIVLVRADFKKMHVSLLGNVILMIVLNLLGLF